MGGIHKGILSTGSSFHYYTQDYLGTPTTGQPYRFGGKELMTANGINEYDFGARWYYPAVPHFTKPDPFCEDFQHLSPYLFCGNDPVNNGDPTGAIFETIWDIGNILYDIGVAIYNHATGNHEAATVNWIDAGLDVSAAIIPGLPAGTSKLLSNGTKAVKGVEKSSDIKNAVEATSDIGKKVLDKSANASKTTDATKLGRSGRQARLKESGDDPKLGKADRAWIKQDQKLKQT